MRTTQLRGSAEGRGPCLQEKASVVRSECGTIYMTPLECYHERERKKEIESVRMQTQLSLAGYNTNSYSTVIRGGEWSTHKTPKRLEVFTDAKKCHDRGQSTIVRGENKSAGTGQPSEGGSDYMHLRVARPTPTCATVEDVYFMLGV